MKFLLLFILAISNLAFAQSTANENMGAIGVSFTRNVLGAIIVKNIQKDSPAFQAGIQVNDFILTIDGKELKGMDSLEVKNRLRGKVGSPVAITLAHAEDMQEYTVNLMRKSVNFSSSNASLPLEPKTNSSTVPSAISSTIPPAKPLAPEKPVEKLAPKPVVMTSPVTDKPSAAIAPPTPLTPSTQPTSPLAPPPEKAAEVKAPDLVYFIQTGTFFGKDMASDQVATFKKKGYPSFVDESIVNGNPVYRVRIGPLNTKDSAEAVSKKLTSQSISNAIIELPKSTTSDSGPKK